MRSLIPLAILTMLILASAEGSACPLVSGLVDNNCDQTVKVAVLGDSIVRGVGEIVNGRYGGYVYRLQARFTDADFINLGISGQTSHELYARLARDLLNVHSS